jgi:hypothetical protein
MDDGVDESGGGGAPSWNDQQGRIRRGNSAAEQVYEQAEVSLAESLSDGDGDGDRDNVEARASAAAEEDAETLTELARETAELIGRLDEEDVDGVVQAISRGASPVAGAMREMATSPVETQGLLEELAREAADLVGRLEEEDARGVVQAISRGASPVAGAMREMATSPVETQGLLEELAREAADLVGRLEEEDARGVVQAISRGASPTSEAMRRMASDSSPSSSPTQQRAANSPQGEGSGREGREDIGDKDMEALAAHGGGENGEDEAYDDPEYDEEEAERRSRVFVDVHVPTPNRGDGLRDTMPAMLDVRIPHVPPRDGERNRPDRPAPRGGGGYDEESLVGSPMIVAYDDEDDWESIGSPVMPYPQALPGRQVSSASTAGSRKSKGGSVGSGKKKRAASASVKGKKSSSMAGGQAGEGARRAYSNPRFTDRPRQQSAPHPLAGSLQRGSPKARPFTAKPSHSGEEEQYRPRTPSMNAKPASPAPRRIRPHTALGISSSSSPPPPPPPPPPPLPSSVAVKGAASKDGSHGWPHEPPSPPPVPARGPPTSEAPPGWSNEQQSPAVKGASTNAGGPGSLKPMLKLKGSQSKKMNKEDFDKFLRRQLAATASKNCLVERECLLVSSTTTCAFHSPLAFLLSLHLNLVIRAFPSLILPWLLGMFLLASPRSVASLKRFSSLPVPVAVSERARKAQFRPQTATTRSSASRYTKDMALDFSCALQLQHTGFPTSRWRRQVIMHVKYTRCIVSRMLLSIALCGKT